MITSRHSLRIGEVSSLWNTPASRSETLDAAPPTALPRLMPPSRFLLEMGPASRLDWRALMHRRSSIQNVRDNLQRRISISRRENERFYHSSSTG